MRLMAQNLFAGIKTFCEKTGSIEPIWSPFIINRFFSMSFNKSVQNVAFKIDRYLFLLDKHDRELIKYIYLASIPKQKAPFIKYIKKASEKEKDNKEIIDIFQKYFNWTDNETAQNMKQILAVIEDKEQLEKLLRFVGADKSLYRKYKIKIVKKKEVVKPTSHSLARWS